MEMPKLHQCISIDRRHKDQDKSWYGGEYVGVVIEVSENKVTIKQSNNTDSSYDFSDEDYTTNWSQYSEIEFESKINDSVKSQVNRIKTSEEDLEDMMKWQHDYVHRYSLMQRLVAFVKSQGV